MQTPASNPGVTRPTATKLFTARAYMEHHQTWFLGIDSSLRATKIKYVLRVLKSSYAHNALGTHTHVYFTGLAAETHGRGVSEKHFTITTTCQQGYLQKTCSARACKAGNHTMAASPATNASNSSSFAFVANQISPRLYRTEALGSPTFANHRQKEIGGPSKRGMVRFYWSWEIAWSDFSIVFWQEIGSVPSARVREYSSLKPTKLAKRLGRPDPPSGDGSKRWATVTTTKSSSPMHGTQYSSSPIFPPQKCGKTK